VIDLARFPEGPISLADAFEADPDAMVLFDRDVVTGIAAKLPDPFELRVQSFAMLIPIEGVFGASLPGVAIFELRRVGRLIASCTPGKGVCQGITRYPPQACWCLIWRPRVWAYLSGREREACGGTVQVTDARWINVSDHPDGHVVEVRGHHQIIIRPPTAAEFGTRLHRQIERQLRRFDPETAEGEDLDALAALAGVKR
jgi:hypothetical protein